MFYFIAIVYYVISQLPACTSDTCILKDQSINQSSSAESLDQADTVLLVLVATA